MSKKDNIDIDEINEAIADETAAEMGYENIKAAQSDLTSKMKATKDSVQRANPDLTDAQAQARANLMNERATGNAFKLVTQILLKVLKQEIEETPSPAFLRIVDQFQEPEYLNEGNTKEYIYDSTTGVTSFDRNIKISQSIAQPSVCSTTLSMFTVNNQGQKQLTNQAFQLKAQVSIPYNEWIPFFTSGKLNEFLNKQREKLAKQWAIYKYDQILGMVSTQTASLIHQATNNNQITTGHYNGGYVLAGTTADLFQAIVKDVYPLLTNLSIMDGNYQAGGTSYNGTLTITNPEDVLILMSPKIEASLRAGIASQLYNPKVFDLKSWVNESNIWVVGNKFNIPGASQWTFNNNTITKTVTNANIGNYSSQENANLSTAITKLDTQYLPDNCLVILNKNMIRLLLQVNTPANQFYSNNLMEDMFLHVWGVYGILPWFPFIVYSNPNLGVLPSDTINISTSGIN